MPIPSMSSIRMMAEAVTEEPNNDSDATMLSATLAEIGCQTALDRLTFVAGLVGPCGVDLPLELADEPTTLVRDILAHIVSADYLGRSQRFPTHAWMVS